MDVMTVTGPINGASLGLTLTHEHLFLDMLKEYRAADAHFDDFDLMAEELAQFTAGGGTTLVEVTTSEIGRDPVRLKQLSVESKVNIIMGCGHYRDPYLDTAMMDRMSVDEVAHRMIHEVEHGVGDTGVRPGIIGEVGADRSYISCAEERSFRAAARTHLATGLKITTHAVKWPVGIAQLDLLRSEGVDPRNVIIGHCDTVPDRDYHEAIATTGAFVQFDTIRGLREYDVRKRLEYISDLVTAGFADQILLSQDLFVQAHLKASGGPGYGYLVNEFREHMTRQFSEDLFTKIMCENPQLALTSAG